MLVCVLVRSGFVESKERSSPLQSFVKSIGSDSADLAEVGKCGTESAARLDTRFAATVVLINTTIRRCSNEVRKVE